MMQLMDDTMAGFGGREQIVQASFSVVVPAYNASNVIGRCLQSLLSQQGQTAFEIIVVDDCSADDTIAKAEEIGRGHNNFSVLRLDSNGGPGIARNAGVLRAKGEWICFVDADDVVENNFLEVLQASVEDFTDILAFNSSLYDAETGNSLKASIREDLTRVEGAERLADYLQDRVDRSVIFHLFRRRFLLDNNIMFRGGLHEDVDYMFHALMRARSVKSIDRQIYRKLDTQGSIVNSLSTRHVDGFFDALDAMHALVADTPMWPDLKNPFLTGIINVTASRLLRLLPGKVVKLEDAGKILSTLHGRVVRSMKLAEIAYPLPVPPSGFRTKYRITFDAFMNGMEKGDTTEDMLRVFAEIAPKLWSCYDLHHSVLLGPGEVRTCCKRFTYEGELKGDVVLFGGNGKDFQFTYSDIKQAKDALFLEINRDNSDECRGCPFLKFEDWGRPLDQGVKYLSFEHHSLCNMRCTYCSETYFGGKKPAYDAGAFIDTLKDAKALENMEYIVWGGGEPTVEPRFDELLSKLAEGISDVKQRVITNATMYSEALADLLRKDQAHIVTSIDAGNSKNFSEIRKYKHFERVFENLRRYAACSSRNVVIKYILLPENSSSDELRQYADLIVENGLTDCNFQISCDFKTDRVTDDQLVSIVELHHLLRVRGARLIFLDDLVWQRILTVTPDTLELLKSKLQPSVLETAFEPAHPEGVVVWGIGGQAQIIRRKSQFFKTSKIAYFIDPRPEMIDQRLGGIEVRAPHSALSDDLPIMIGAVQSAPEIYDQIEALGISPQRILQKVIL